MTNARALSTVLVTALTLVVGEAPPASPGSGAERELWVTSQGTDRVFVLSFPEGERLAEISLPPGTQPHITTFHGGQYAYVSGMGNGTITVLDADRRQVVHTLTVGTAGAHQARISPDGKTMLVAVVSGKRLHKVAVDEAVGSWRHDGSLMLEGVGAPICTVFRADSRRAYVSLLPSGLAVVDVPTMTVVRTIPTDGFVACGMIVAPDGRQAVVAAGGGGGHIYTLDMETDSLEDRGTLGAGDWHSFIMTPDGRRGFGTSPKTDEVVVVDLTTRPVTRIYTLRLDPVKLPGANQPDAVGGGETVVDGTLPVSLRAAGQLALIDTATLETRVFIRLARPAPFNPATCAGCALHGVTVRPAGRGR
ncbi:MAG TPA: hypothetical protein VNN07_10865 [Candidatus Tectomicrobia bacterium]|nr:hypothetical protein [Candidatus Tectomicrobia bacterium]